MIVDQLWMAGIVGMMVVYGGFALSFSKLPKNRKNR
jgi:hypothetical protein